MKSLRFVLGFLVVGVVLFYAAPSHAGLMNGYSGWSEFSDCDYCDTIINFSVYQTEDADWTDDLFFSSVGSISNQYGTLDQDAQYVYMYQVVNVDPVTSGEEDIEKLSIRYFNGGFSSGGHFNNTVFYDSAGQIDGANWGLSASASFTGDDPINVTTGQGDGSPSSIVSTTGLSLGVDGTGNIQDPMSLYSTSGGCPGPSAPCNVMIFNFPSDQFQLDHENNEYSSVLFLTSNSAPDYHFGETESGQGTGADGEIPTVVPEPVSTVLFLLGGITMGVRRFRRKSD